nr:unnamed protein product [Callosobruchus chinensis]
MDPLKLLLLLVTVSCFANEMKPNASSQPQLLGKAVFKALAEAGHDVTVVTCFHEEKVPKGGKWREILLKDYYEKFSSKYIVSSVGFKRQCLGFPEGHINFLNSKEQFGAMNFFEQGSNCHSIS